MTTARTLLTLLAAAVIGLIGYQIGIGQNLAAQIPAGAAPAYWYGPHFAFGGFFGLFFGILILFLFIGLLRAAMWGGRGWHGRGYGPGWMSDERRARFEELHRELHGEKPRTGGQSTST
jgi:hypothetical protein